MTVLDPRVTPLAISLLGPFSAHVNGAPFLRLHSHKEEAILALLTLRHHRPVERAWLAGLLWPEASESQGLATLRRYLAYLRRALGSAASRLQSPTSSSLTLDLTGATVDLLSFETALARGERQSLEEAVALYQGPLLEGWTEEWVFEERLAREATYLQALEALAADALEGGDLRSAERHLRRVMAVDPLRESAQRALMQALAAGGRYAAVIQSYRDLRLLLHRELNAEPAAETEALFQQLRTEARKRAARGSRLAARSPDDGRSDVERSAIAFAASREPRAASGSAATSHNLPVSLTRFIGREREIAEVTERLPSTRLLTLTGVGGCGKTRLALEVSAQALADYTHGVWLVELAALSDPALLPQTVAGVLKVREQPGRSVVETLTNRLRGRQALLVLDNCEHLVAACASLVDTLLRACPHLRILATSRQPLGIAGETAWPVPPLSLPPPVSAPGGEDLTRYESVRLFVDRAIQALPDFRMTPREASAVAQVCRRLDGLPLALELAAARVRALSIEQIAQRLEDRFRLLTGGSRTALPRHQTLRALFDWSYDLLSEAERTLLRRLSVFAGGWRLEAAEAVCGGLLIADCRLMIEETPDPSPISNQQSAISDPEEVLHLLISLVEKSLVLYEERGGDARYRLLQTVRQYAWDRLLEVGETEVFRDRHLDFFLALAEQAQPQLRGPEVVRWLERLEAEHDNLRAALRWSQERGASPEGARDVEPGLRLGTALFWFWQTRGYRAEGWEHMAALLAVQRRTPPPSGAPVATAARAAALHAAGSLAAGQGDQDTAWALCQESLALARELDDHECIAGVLISLANVACSRGDLQTASDLCQESLAIGRALEDPDPLAWSLFTLGNVAHYRGDYGTAQAHYQESLAIWRQQGDKRCISSVLNSLGEMALRQGDCATAEALHEESLEIKRELGDRPGIAACLSRLGNVAYCQRDHDRAREFYERGLAVYQEVDETAGMAWLLNSLARVAHDQGKDEAARSFLARALSLWRELGDSRWGLAECLEELARSVSRQEQPEWTARLLGAAAALRGDDAPPRPPSEEAEYERLVASVRAALGAETFASAWAAGRAMGLDEVMTFALESAGDSPSGAE